ncbi:hypothetical protein J4230_03855 [Candidatus Woesearchaeota archaeon]|nr:hypothetical protein [Candidatus Woesearchaeota archaeon]
MPEDQIKLAFSKVKQDIQTIFDELLNIKKELSENKENVKEILLRLESIKDGKKKQKEGISTGNDGANQSINHLINQSITNQSFNQSIHPINANYEGIKQFDPEKGANHLINQSLINQSINHSQDEKLKNLTVDISKTFLSLSKQELKLFLTIYQLEDESIEPSYKNLSLKMNLSEHCIRSHLSSLLKKNTPIIKKRLNNHTNLLSISKEFRALNLKQKLINLYYESDPHQKTLFDVN